MWWGVVNETFFGKRTLAPFLALVIGAVLIAVALCGLWAVHMNQEQSTREEHYAVIDLQLHQKSLETELSPILAPDPPAAVNRAWINQLLKSSGFRSRTFDMWVILDDQNRPIAAYQARGEIPLDGLKPAISELAPTLNAFRRHESRFMSHLSNPLSGVTHLSETDLVTQSGAVKINNEVFLVAIAPLTQALSSRRAPILIGFERIDSNWVTKFGQTEEMIKARRFESSALVPKALAKLSLKTGQGKELMVIAWDPYKPGDRLMLYAILPAMVFVCLLTGGWLWLFYHGRKMFDALKASEERFAHLALHDTLTALPNRHMMSTRLTEALSQLQRQPDKQHVLAMIDVDRFKELNETMGPSAGDELIQQISERLISQCRSSDLLARLSGDQFAILSPFTSPTAAAAMAERLVRALKGSYAMNGQQVHVTASIGLTQLTHDVTDVSEALRQAELALGRAKKKGTAEYHFFEVDMDLRLKKRKGLERDLREAISEGRLSMAYQPQVDAHGRLVGVEALVRWNHPTQGPISPGEFIPLAEEAGLISGLGDFVMVKSMMDSKRWPHISVAINVSALQLRNPNYADHVESLLRQTGAQANRIELEITEGVLLNDNVATHHTLSRLRSLGFSVALDDFGTGFSSLSYLSTYPVDKIKIDRSFINPITRDPSARAVVKGIVNLARDLNLKVLAEGVETVEQRSVLSDIGCELIQGYLTGKPAPAETIDLMARPSKLSTRPPSFREAS